MGAATDRIAAKLAARKSGAAAPAADPEDDEAPEDEAPEDEDTEAQVDDDEPGDDEDEDEEETTAPKRMTRSERIAARKAKSTKAVAETKPVTKAATKSTGTNGTGSGKKTPSPAQLAAREKFAAASRARAAAARGDTPDTEEDEKPQTKAEIKRLQSEAEVKARQNEQRKAAKVTAAEAPVPTREKTSRAKGGKATKAVAKAGFASRAPAPGQAKAGSLKPAKGTKAKAEGSKRSSDTKEKVLALWAKGKTRKEIMAALDLSYAAVFFHTKGVAGTGSGARGSIFVETNLDEDGNKMRGGKKVEVNRSEAMRRSYLSGTEIGDVGREFGVRYQIAYTAIRPLLGEVEGEDDEE